MKVYVPPVRRLLRELRADGADVIHMTTPGPMGLAALFASSELQLPLIGSFHTHLAEYTTRLSGSQRLGGWMREYLRWIYGKCQQILAPSQATCQVLIDAKIDPAKLAIWERGVCTDRFSPAKRSPELRRQWRVADDCPALVYVGRLSKEKGLSEIPIIQTALRQASIDHRLIFVGDGPMRADLQRLCPDAVFTGALPHHQVAVAMASSDLFLFPSRTDTAGNVVLEAQASGLPVLVTNEGGPQENLIPGRSGEVCGTTAEFMVHVERYCRDRSLRARRSAAAREFACGRTWRVSLEPLIRAYREAGARHAAAAAVTPDALPVLSRRHL
jgi:glycosyltransferase involved in cell wall biosynthesis